MYISGIDFRIECNRKVRREVALDLCIAKYFVTVFDNELYSVVFRVHIGHFTVQAVVSHYSGCEDDGQVLRCHLQCISLVSTVMMEWDNIPNFRFL